MARKSKVGLDYFPHNCNYDDELKYIIALYKEAGYYVYFELLRKIYNGEGYYTKIDKKIITLFSKEINTDIDKINDIINECLSENLFNKLLYKNHNIITSKGIQERYFEAIKRRKVIGIVNEYILVDYVNIINEDADIIILNVDKSTQSKVKYSKVKESIELHPLQKYIFKTFSNISKIKNQLTKEECERLLKQYSKENVNNILEQMENKQDLTKKYTSVNLTLRSWLKRNIKDPEKKILAVN